MVVDPGGFGQPIFMRGAPAGRLGAVPGPELLAVVAQEYAIPRAQLEDAARIAGRIAA